MAGVASFQFVEALGIDSLPDPVAGIINQITLKSGYAWKAGYSAYDSLQFEEEPIESDHGLYFNSTLRGFVPDAAAINTLFSEMKGRWFILKITDNDGLIRIVGTLDQPLQFSSHLDTETASGQKGHSYAFKGIQKNKAPIYTI